MVCLPALDDLSCSPPRHDSPLSVALEILFEPSPVLISILEPQLSEILASRPPLTSYSEFIDISLGQIAKWDITAQSNFISGHPRIGQNRNLSNLSAKEQGTIGVAPTPPEVLARLTHLNACYEAKYPGLRYITFVNGRRRSVIAEVMEEMLGLEHSLSAEEPLVDDIVAIPQGSDVWCAELNRAVQDVGRIAKSRLGALGVN